MRDKTRGLSQQHDRELSEYSRGSLQRNPGAAGHPPPGRHTQLQVNSRFFNQHYSHTLVTSRRREVNNKVRTAPLHSPTQYPPERPNSGTVHTRIRGRFYLPARVWQNSIRKKTSAAMSADIGMVRIQAQTTDLATPQRTAESLRVAPTPTMAPVIV